MNAPEVLAHYHAVPTLVEEVRMKNGSFYAWDKARSLTLEWQGWRIISPDESAKRERERRDLREALQDLMNNPFQAGTPGDKDLKVRAANILNRRY